MAGRTHQTRCYTLLLQVVLASGLAGAQAGETKSGDAYVHLDEKSGTVTIGTSMVEQKVRFSGGTYAAVEFRNKLSKRKYGSTGQPGEEFRVLLNGKMHTGTGGAWIWKGGEATVLPQGEIQLTVRLEDGPLRVEKTYVVYPETGIIRQWVSYQNRSNSPIRLANPYFLSHRLWGEEAEKLALYYMTGGGSFTGSQLLKEVRLSKEYARTFDTTDKPERVYMAGMNSGGALPYGSGVYMPWFCVSDTAAAEGFFVGLDYYGRWAAEIGNYQGGPGYLGLRLGGYEKELAPGETVETPKAFTGVFTGDLDSMGNQSEGLAVPLHVGPDQRRVFRQGAHDGWVPLAIRQGSGALRRRYAGQLGLPAGRDHARH